MLSSSLFRSDEVVPIQRFQEVVVQRHVQKGLFQVIMGEEVVIQMTVNELPVPQDFVVSI